ncbi:dihydrofolate reductase family protein [Nocardia sp. BMG111209]|uniref:dihydrofolate reductase family protein n=1 Tax=Nocardia sp. BMG111209 TaxID=1160137 RepID=UPI00037456B6|nr:dihydrofolate reductase family protein [Nocardia sp. BMG111209]
MAGLIYSAIASLDGYIEDAQGEFDWAAPDDEVLAAVNEIERPIGTYLYGRRMYETMRYWATAPTGADRPVLENEFTRIWRQADKIVYSRTLQSVSTERTRLERTLDPAAIAGLKKSADRDISVGGADLARQVFAAGLVDEIHLFLGPILVGRGKQALPEGIAVDLELLSERRFHGGVVHLHYRVRS